MMPTTTRRPYSRHVAELRSARLRPFVKAAFAMASRYSTADLAYIVEQEGYRQGLRVAVAWFLADEYAIEAEEQAAAAEARQARESRERASIEDCIARVEACDAARREVEPAVAAASASPASREVVHRARHSSRERSFAVARHSDGGTGLGITP